MRQGAFTSYENDYNLVRPPAMPHRELSGVSVCDSEQKQMPFKQVLTEIATHLGQTTL